MRYLSMPSIIIVTTILVIRSCLAFTEIDLEIAGVIFISSPLFVIWMAINVLRDKKYTGSDFRNDEEWGYADDIRANA